MKFKALGIIALILLMFAILRIIFFVVNPTNFISLETPLQVINHFEGSANLANLAYINAMLFIIFTCLLFAGLFSYLLPYSKVLSIMGIIFVPVYATINLLIDLCQPSIILGLISITQQSESLNLDNHILNQLIQQYSTSGALFINQSANTILGIPFIIFGYLLTRQNRILKGAGILLITSGILNILGVIGISFGRAILDIGSVVCGILFLFSLIFISIHFLKR